MAAQPRTVNFRSQKLYSLILALFSTGAASLSTLQASGAHVTVITTQPPGSAGYQLLDVTTTGRKKIADLEGDILFGKDDSKLAAAYGTKQGTRVLVFNRGDTRATADFVLTNVSLVPRLWPMTEQISVQSRHSLVCFPIAVTNGGRASMIAVNWKKPYPPLAFEEKQTLEVPTLWASWPGKFALGFATAAPANPAAHKDIVRVAVFDPAKQKETLNLELPDNKEAPAKRQIFFVPKVGLMGSYRGAYSQLTDANCSMQWADPTATATSGTDSKIHVRTIKGKTCLIWGEDNSAEALRGKSTGEITDLVIYNLQTKTEVLRKPLPKNISAMFEPDASGKKIYFVDHKAGKMSCLDTSTETITPFGDLGPHEADLDTIVDAE